MAISFFLIFIFQMVFVKPKYKINDISLKNIIETLKIKIIDNKLKNNQIYIKIKKSPDITYEFYMTLINNIYFKDQNNTIVNIKKKEKKKSSNFGNKLNMLDTMKYEPDFKLKTGLNLFIIPYFDFIRNDMIEKFSNITCNDIFEYIKYAFLKKITTIKFQKNIILSKKNFYTFKAYIKAIDDNANFFGEYFGSDFFLLKDVTDIIPENNYFKDELNNKNISIKKIFNKINKWYKQFF